MKQFISILLFATALCACNRYKEADATRVCGVPVKGTPWELVAAVADHGDGTFVPECVTVYSEKAYIDGWVNTNVTDAPYREEPYDDGFLPAKLICDVIDGKVIHAWIDCQILDSDGE